MYMSISSATRHENESASQILVAVDFTAVYAPRRHEERSEKGNGERELNPVYILGAPVRGLFGKLSSLSPSHRLTI